MTFLIFLGGLLVLETILALEERRAKRSGSPNTIKTPAPPLNDSGEREITESVLSLLQALQPDKPAVSPDPHAPAEPPVKMRQ